MASSSVMSRGLELRRGPRVRCPRRSAPGGVGHISHARAATSTRSRWPAGTLAEQRMSNGSRACRSASATRRSSGVPAARLRAGADGVDRAAVRRPAGRSSTSAPTSGSSRARSRRSALTSSSPRLRCRPRGLNIAAWRRNGRPALNPCPRARGVRGCRARQRRSAAGRSGWTSCAAPTPRIRAALAAEGRAASRAVTLDAYCARHGMRRGAHATKIDVERVTSPRCSQELRWSARRHRRSRHGHGCEVKPAPPAARPTPGRDALRRALRYRRSRDADAACGELFGAAAAAQPRARCSRRFAAPSPSLRYPA